MQPITTSERLRILSEALEPLLSSRAMTDLIPRILDLAGRLLGANAYAIRRVGDDGRWKAVADAGLSPEYSRLEYSDEERALSAESICCADAHHKVFPEKRREAYRREGIAAILCIPLRVASEEWGTIVFYFRQPTELGDDELQAAGVLAEIARAAISTLELREAHEQAAIRLRFLSEASAALSSSLDYEATLNQVARLAIKSLADWCTVHLKEPDGSIRRAVVAHGDPERIRWADEVSLRYPLDPEGKTGVPQVIRTGESAFYPDIPPDLLKQSARDQEHLEILQEAQLKGVIIAPLKLRDRVLGALTLVSAESGRTYTEEDLGLAEQLAGRAAAAIENAVLYRQAQSTLEEVVRGEERLRLITDSLPVLVSYVDSTGRYRFMNRSYAEWFGCELNQMIGLTIAEVLGEDMAGYRAPYVTRALRGESVRFDAPTRLKSGEIIDTELTYVPDCVGDTVRGFFVLVQDITERNRAATDRGEQEERFRAAVDAGQLGTWDWNIQKDILTWSPRLYEMHGLRPGAFGGRVVDFEALIHTEDRERVRAEIRRTMETGAPYHTEFRVLTPSGELRWLLTNGRVTYDSAGSPACMMGATLDVTDRRRAEAALAASDQRYRSFVQQSSEGIWRFELDEPMPLDLAVDDQIDWMYRNAYLAEANDAMARMYGHDEASELTGGRLADFLPRSDPANELYLRAFIEAGHRLENGESHEFDRHGRQRIFINNLVGFAEGGRLMRAWGLQRDITEQRSLEQETRETSERLTLATRAASIGAFDWDIPTGQVIWTEQEELIFGLEPGSFEGTLEGWSRRLLPEDLLSIRKSMREHWARRDTEIDFTFRIIRSDGALRTIEGSARSIYGEDGAPLRMVGVNIDVTQRRAAEQRLRLLAEASAQLASVGDFREMLDRAAAVAIPEFADFTLLHLTDETGQVRREAEAHSNPQQSARLAATWPQAPLPADHPAHEVITSGRPRLWVWEAAELDDPELPEVLRVMRPGCGIIAPLRTRESIIGTITFFLAPARPRYQPGDILLAQQYAERVAVALENARLYAELRDSDRRKDEFLAMLAHELRNPLSPILNAASLLSSRASADPAMVRLTEIITRNARHLARLVDDLLEVSRINRGKIELRLERVDLASVVEQAVAASGPLIEKKQHELRLEVSAQPLWAIADPTRLVQVIVNLLNNAAKYTDPGGSIHLVLRRERGSALISIRDSGRGISPELLPRMFDLFVQGEQSLARSEGGLGIGLTLARRLVEMHGGSISAESDGPGKGAAVTVSIPLAARGGAEPQAVSTEHEAPPGAPRRVLVVEDNADAAETLTCLLRNWGHSVSVARDGDEAARLAAESAPEIVLLDIGLPGKDGFEIAADIRSTAGEKRVLLVALTGYGDEETRARALAAGFDDYLTKPVEPASLQDLLAHIDE